MEFFLFIICLTIGLLTLYYVVKFAVKNALKEYHGSDIPKTKEMEPLDLNKLQVDDKTLLILKNHGLISEEEYQIKLRNYNMNYKQQQRTS